MSEDGGESWQELNDVDTVFGGIGGHGLVFVPPVPDAAPYTLYSGCEVGLCRSPDGGQTWEVVEGALRPSVSHMFNTPMVANSDGERVRLFIGAPGGIAGAARQTAAPRDNIPGLDQLLSGGVYRLTDVLTDNVYLPAVFDAE